MTQQLEDVAVCVQAGVPVLLWGQPGTGKTSAVNALGRALGLPVETVIASVREPSDFAGLPVLTSQGVVLHAPAWARRLQNAGKGILFLDEVSTAAPAVQAALLRVVLDRVVGDLPLPESVSIIAAANPPETAAGGWDLSAPLANRFCHLSWSVDSGVWADGMLSGFAMPSIRSLPPNWQDTIPQARSLVAAFIHARPHLLLQVPKNESEAGRAWPSPRSWDMAARLIAACTAGRLGEKHVIALVAGCVGHGPASELIHWRKSLDLPNPEDLLKNPASFRLPDRGDVAYAVLAAVVQAAISNLTPQRWLAAWDILAASAAQGSKDIAASAARLLASHRDSSLPTPTKQIKEFLPLLKASGLL